MLREHDDVEQDGSGNRRRWFESEPMDLIVWTAPDGALPSFQLCLRDAEEWAVVWRREWRTLRPFWVDTGEQRPFSHKASPVLVPAAPRQTEGLAESFSAEASALEPALAIAVMDALRGG